MKQMNRYKRQYTSFCLGLCSLMLLMLSACVHQLSQEPDLPAGPGTAPALSGLKASPNPAASGEMIRLTTTFEDPDSDFHSGLAAISVNGEKPSSIAFRTTYPSGILTFPFPVSTYSRPSNLHITLKVRDDAGNWSNAVSMTLQIREPVKQAPLPTKEDEGLL